MIRFAELYHQVNFPKAITLLREWRGLASLLNAVVDCYRLQLQRYNEAFACLDQQGIHSGEVIEHMRIGYAPGGCLRSCLLQLGYPLSVMQRAGLVNASGHDSYSRRIVFRWMEICMAVVFGARRHRIRLCRARRVVCTDGSTSDDIPR